MDAELKTKWVEALRSGKYQQAQGSLRLPQDGKYAFCCLGVLCDVAGTEWEEGSECGILDGQQVRAPMRSFLSPPLLERAGLDNDKQERLAGMNDDGRSFKQIAAYIDRYL